MCHNGKSIYFFLLNLFVITFPYDRIKNNLFFITVYIFTCDKEKLKLIKLN